jgi:acyl carrier protein phosphodiesterase
MSLPLNAARSERRIVSPKPLDSSWHHFTALAWLQTKPGTAGVAIRSSDREQTNRAQIDRQVNVIGVLRRLAYASTWTQGLTGTIKKTFTTWGIERVSFVS